MQIASKRHHLFLAWIFIIAFLSGIKPIEEPDLGWHLKTGEYLFKNNLIPDKNLFSFTFPDHSWQATFWIFDWFIYLTHRVLGNEGLLLFQSGIIALTFSILFYVTFKKTRNDASAFIITFLALYLSINRLSFRPYFFTTLFLLIFVALFPAILKQINSKLKLKELIILTFVMLIWTNIHGGFIFGLAFIWIAAFGEAINTFVFFKKKDRLAYFFLIPLFFTLLTSVNPSGFETHKYVLGHIDLYKKIPIVEMRSMSLNNSDDTATLVLILLTLIASIIKMGKEKEITSFLLILGFGIVSIKSVRVIPDLFVVLAPVFSWGAIFFYDNIKNWLRVKKIGLYFVFILFIIYSFLVIYDKTTNFQNNIKVNKNYPLNAVNFIKKKNLPGNMYNSYDYGGYLMWNLPEKPVFQDGRTNAYPLEFLKRANVTHDAVYWNTLMDEYKINIAVVQRYQNGVNFSSFFLREKWALVFWDQNSYIFLKRAQENSEWIKQNEYKFFNSNLELPAIFNLYSKENIKPLLLKEMEKNVFDAPDHDLAIEYLGVIYMESENSYYASGIKLLQRATALSPYIYNYQFNLAVAFIKLKRFEEAKDLLAKYIEEAPSDTSEWSTAKKIFDDLNK